MTQNELIARALLGELRALEAKADSAETVIASMSLFPGGGNQQSIRNQEVSARKAMEKAYKVGGLIGALMGPAWLLQESEPMTIPQMEALCSAGVVVGTLATPVDDARGVRIVTDDGPVC